MNRRGDNTGPQPVSRILTEVLRECGLTSRLEERNVLLHWRQIVGDEIAAHSRAMDLKDGVLILEADHGAWRQELTLLVPKIITKFNALFGEGTVTEIQWHHQPGQNRKRNHNQ